MVEGLTLHQAPSAFPAVPAATVTLSFRRTPPGARNRTSGAAILTARLVGPDPEQSGIVAGWSSGSSSGS